MNKLEEFLQRDKDAMESRQYRYREQEIMKVNSIIKEIEEEDKKKRADFKESLKKLGVKVTDERKKD